MAELPERLTKRYLRITMLHSKAIIKAAQKKENLTLEELYDVAYEMYPYMSDYTIKSYVKAIIRMGFSIKEKEVK